MLYPGFSAISGLELSTNLKQQALNFGAEFINGEVIKINNKQVILSNSDTYEAKAIIIATGSKERKLDLPQVKEFTGKGISYCATCDGFFFRNKPVCVIGDNNNALEESLYLANLASKVTFIIKKDKLSGDEVLINKVLNNDKIELINNATLNSLIIEDNRLVGLSIKQNNIDKSIDCLGIFPYISFNPSTDFLDPSILDEKGFIKTNSDMSTTIDGIYAAGDCIQKDLRQVVTACADGAIAASSIIKYIKNKA